MPPIDIIDERYAKDLAFMRQPKDWPKWPLLPLTRRGVPFTDPSCCAFLLADERPVIYLGTIYEMAFTNAKTWDEAIKPFKRQEYASFEALADDYTVD